MIKLPEGWSTTLLGNICTKPQYGYTTKSSSAGTIRYLRTTDITKAVVNWIKVPYCQSNPDDVSKYQLHLNDILVSRAGSVGFSHLYEGGSDDPVVFASYLIRFTPLKGIQPNFIKYFLGSESYWDQISDISAGIAIQNVNAQNLSKLKLPIPPTNEQKRIVEKLDRILEEVNSAKARLDQIPSILKSFRQSIIDQYISKVNTDKKIRTVELQEVCHSISDGDHQAPPKTDQGIPFLVISNITKGFVDLESVTRFVPESYYKNLKGIRTPYREISYIL